jgi:hypothetical protein
VALLSKLWVPLVVAVAVVLGGVAVNRLRDAFGSEAVFSTTGRSAQPLDPSHVNQVTYDVYGPSQTSGSVSYLDMNAQAHQANFTGLPWRLTVSTTVPVVLASVVVQGDSDSIGCRITVNGAVKDEQSADGYHAQTSCLVKAA